MPLFFVRYTKAQTTGDNERAVPLISLSNFSTGTGSLSLYFSPSHDPLDVHGMLSTLLAILTTLSVARAAPISINSTVVCSAGQCIQGFTNTTSTLQQSTLLIVLTDLYPKLALYYHRLMYPLTSFSFLANTRRRLIRSCSTNFLQVLRLHPLLQRASMLPLFLSLSTSR